ncbi:MAG: pyridoxal phosphate-dependent aminotransferase [Bacteroidia bacterium]|nr:pyridoxal phosphate-dependent aminotransferase [Bacteroidia bacterium]
MDISPTLAMNALMKARISSGLETYRFGFGQSPFPIPQHLVKALKEYAHEKDYVPTEGLPELRQSIANYYSSKYDWSITSEQIVVGPGSKELIFLTQLISERNLVLPSPSWVSYAPQAQLLKKKVNWIKTDYKNKWKLQADVLEDFLMKTDEKLFLILNYPGNPTGITYSDHELKSIAEIARKYDLLIISDEIYSEFTFEKTHCSIYNYYPEGTIICNGLSKWCGAGGWRLGFIIFPNNLIKLRASFIKAGSETYSCATTPVQYAAIEAFENSEAQNSYTRNCNIILNYIANQVHKSLDKSRINTHLSEGGFYCFLNFRKEHYNYESSDVLCEKLLKETGVALLPGTAFGLAPEVLSARLAFVDIDGAQLIKDLINTKSHQQNLYLNISRITKGISCINNW